MTADEYRNIAADWIGTIFNALTSLIALTAEYAGTNLEPSAPSTPARSRERLFTQAEVDYIVRERLAKAERSHRARPQLTGAVDAPHDNPRKETR